MNKEHKTDDSPEVQATMRALGEEPKNTPKQSGDQALRQTATALKDAYGNTALPPRSDELLAAINAELDAKPQPAKERPMTSGKRKPTGVFVLTVATAIVAVVVTLLWQWSGQQEQLADIGQMIGNVDQSYSSEGGVVILDNSASTGTADQHARCLTLGGEVTTTSGTDGVVVMGPTNYDVIANGTATNSTAVTPGQNIDLYGGTNIHHWQYEEVKQSARHLHIVPPGDGASVAYGFVPGHEKFAADDLAAIRLGDADEVVKLDIGGEGLSGQRYERIYENAFKAVHDNPLSTFSIDVDTASYSKTRQYLQNGQLPPPDAVRIEELVNYFPYDYLPPMGADPFTAHMEVSECPWNAEHRLARIAIKGQVMEVEDRPHSNLVFLLDVSGSMNQPNKLPLVKKGLRMLVERLGEKDRVAIVTYAGDAGLVLDSTTCDEKAAIMKAIDDLQPGGSTAGAAGITLAYEIARKNFIENGVNRVLLCTDGDFNVGVSDDGGLVRLAEEQAKHNVFLSILGFGSDNLNDSMLEQVSGKANGMYAFIDSENEARKVLVEQLSGTLVTIAKDVKIQIEFNPAKVKGYRLIGYENRMLAAEDFNDDTKDAGEIGAGHNVTALYEIVPADAKVEVDAADVDDLKYQKPSVLTDAADSEELLTLKLRFKQPDGEKSSLISFPIDDDTQRFSEASDDFQFAAAVASFGMLLRGSRYAGDTSYDAVHEIASASLGDDEWGYRTEFVELVAKAKELTK